MYTRYRPTTFHRTSSVLCRTAKNCVSHEHNRLKVYAYRYEGKRYDCGSKEGFLEANVELALKHEQVGAWFRDYLRGLQLKLD